jgi:hypothetical protein
MSDWSTHQHIATVGLGNPLFERSWCAKCGRVWPCPTAKAKRAYEDTALTQLAKINERADRIAFVMTMRAGLLSIDASGSPWRCS